MAKLLLSGRVISQKLLARLLVLWLDPSTQEEARLRAVLGLFFPAFATADRCVLYTSVKIIKNEVGCRDDTVPKTVDTRRHCEED